MQYGDDTASTGLVSRKKAGRVDLELGAVGPYPVDGVNLNFSSSHAATIKILVAEDNV